MAWKPHVLELLEEILDSGKTPEEACRDCPELLPEVRERWQEFRVIDAQIGELIPGCQSDPSATRLRAMPHVGGMPEIPGYEVEAVLGHGGMGVVYKARQRALGRFVAVKMLLAGPFAGAQELERFRRETAALASLRHTHIVQVYDAGDVEGQPYFTMELIEGGSLAQKLAGTPQRARPTAELLATLAEALQVAHQGGIVHRDLKPANILITADGTPKLTDFGLARRLDGDAGLTQSGVPMGTPSYMAPEQARGQARGIGPAVDTYALGAILYEMLTGRPPFRAETVTDTLLQVMHQEPVPPTRLNGKVPRDLETICLKCLQKDPSRRYATAADLSTDLGRFLRHEPVRARPTGRVEHFLRWVRRRPAATGLLATLAVVVVALGIGALLLYQQQVAAQIQQAETDGEVRGILTRARGLLDEGWARNDLAKLTEARAETNRAVDIARSGGASLAAQQEASAVHDDAVARLERAKRNRALLEALLEVSAPQETRAAYGDIGWTLAQPTVDEQYKAAFQHWGLDVDRTPLAKVVERLRQEPDMVKQEITAGLDAWMLARRWQGRPKATYLHLYHVAEQLDRHDGRQQLRAVLSEGVILSPQTVTGLVGAGSPWTTLAVLGRTSLLRQSLEQLAKIDARTAPVLTVALLARVLEDAGETAKAESLLHQAVVARPDQVVLLDALGKLIVRQEPARLSEAIGYYRAARALRPDLGIALGEALFRAGRMREAEAVFRELDPRNPMACYGLGVVLFAQQKNKEAEAAFRRAAELQPDHGWAHLGIGNALLRQRKYREAEAAYRKAVEVKPDFPAAHNYLGQALLGQQKYGEAVAACQQAIELEPAFARAHLNLSSALFGQGKYAQAELASRKAIVAKPDLANAWHNLGNALSRQGRPREAEAAFRHETYLKPGDAIAWYNLGNALRMQEDYAGAEAAYKKTIGIQSDNPEFHNNLGMVLVLQRKPDEAETAFRKAIDLRHDFGVAHHNLGRTLMQRARFVEASEVLKKAFDSLPANHPLRNRVRQLQEQCRRYTVLEARLPAILQGTEKVAGGTAQLEIAQLCQFKNLNAAAAHFYRDAFAAEPRLAEAMAQGTRYEAACAATLAGCKHGQDADQLNEPERARWRRQALEWLRQDVAWYSKRLDEGNAQVRQQLRRLQREPTFAYVRAKDGLDKLPEEERKNWQQFWSDVDALLRRGSARD